MKTSKNIGIWIDSKEATVITLAGGKATSKTVISEIERKPRFKGESSRKTKQSFTGFDFESSQKAHFENELQKFLKRVTKEVSADDNLYIFGPAKTKTLLENELKHAYTNIHVLGVEPAARLTGNQKVERVKKFYKSLSPN